MGLAKFTDPMQPPNTITEVIIAKVDAKVTMIAHSNGKPWALIDDQWLTVGDTIKKMKITRIDPDRVILTAGKRSKSVLTLEAVNIQQANKTLLNP